MDDETRHDLVQDPAIRAASDSAEQAYVVARPVYDRCPRGLPSRDELPDRERALVDDLERADAAVKRMRAEALAKPHRRHPAAERSFQT